MKLLLSEFGLDGSKPVLVSSQLLVIWNILSKIK